MLPNSLQISYPDFWQEKEFIKKINLDCVTVIVKKGKDGPKFTIIVPKVVDKRATRRNASRRVLENWIRENLMLFQNNFIYLFKIRKIINRDNKGEILSNLSRDLKKELR